jgi:hypothetical protein
MEADEGKEDVNMLRHNMRSMAKDVHAVLEAHGSIYAARSASVPTFGHTNTTLPEVPQLPSLP